jgi:hypothetical protein
MVVRPTLALVACTAALLAAGPTRAQALWSITAHEVWGQYGGAGSAQTVLRDPWFVTASVPPWSLEGDFGIGHYEVGVASLGSGSANSYAGFSMRLRNVGAAPQSILSSSVTFSALFTQFDDGSDGSLFNRLISVWSVTANGRNSTARLDHTWSAICQSNRQQCRSNADTNPVLNGGGAVTVVSAGAGGVWADLHLPALTLGPGNEALFQFSFQASVGANGGWGASVDATNSAQAAMTLEAGATLVGGPAVSWIRPVPEPSGLLLGAFGAAALLAWNRRRA